MPEYKIKPTCKAVKIEDILASQNALGNKTRDKQKIKIGIKEDKTT